MSGPEEATGRAVIVGPYRYSLERVWNPDLPTVSWVMCNPSTADAVENDPTLRRCLGFSARYGYGRLLVVNLWAWRATSPRELAIAAANGLDVQGPENLNHLSAAVADVDVILAWGAFPRQVPGSGLVKKRVNALVRSLARSIACLGVTEAMEPRHPLYVPAARNRVWIIQPPAPEA